MNLSKITTLQLLLILGVIIVVLPPLLTLTAFFDFLDFSDSGGIGDTLGGITAPFINSIAAILVFVAFKEQIRANELLKEQQYFSSIQDQIHRLEDDVFKINEIISNINYDLMQSQKMLNNYENNEQIHYHISGENLNRAIYVTTQFQHILELVNHLSSNQDFMNKKIRTLYKIIYQDQLRKLDSILKGIMHMKSSSEGYVAELLFQLKDLEKELGGTIQTEK